MARQTILIIRHADKPEPGGVDAVGVPDKRSLTPRGWQRAGIWTELFAPSFGQQSVLPKPAAIFASAPASKAEISAGNGGSKSRRPLETISALAAQHRRRPAFYQGTGGRPGSNALTDGRGHARLLAA